jgi:hypothetical protein
MIQTDRHGNSFTGGPRRPLRNSTQSHEWLPVKQGIDGKRTELLHAWL